MKKQLRFLYRYLIRAGYWRTILNAQTLLIVVVSGVFLTVLFTSTPRSGDSPPTRSKAGSSMLLMGARAVQAQAPTESPPTAESATETTIAPTPTRTPFPPEFYENADQTGGITLAGVALVVIVLVGLWTLRPRKGE